MQLQAIKNCDDPKFLQTDTGVWVNSVDLDQTAPECVVRSGSTLFAIWSFGHLTVTLIANHMSHDMTKPTKWVCTQQRSSLAHMPLCWFCYAVAHFRIITAISFDRLIFRFSWLSTEKKYKYWDTWNYCCNYPKILEVWFQHTIIHPKYVESIANSVDPDQTAPIGSYRSSLTSVCTACTCLSVPKLRIFMAGWFGSAVCTCLSVLRGRSRDVNITSGCMRRNVLK